MKININIFDCIAKHQVHQPCSGTHPVLYYVLYFNFSNNISILFVVRFPNYLPCLHIHNQPLLHMKHNLTYNSYENFHMKHTNIAGSWISHKTRMYVSNTKPHNWSTCMVEHLCSHIFHMILLKPYDPHASQHMLQI